MRLVDCGSRTTPAIYLSTFLLPRKFSLVLGGIYIPGPGCFGLLEWTSRRWGVGLRVSILGKPNKFSYANRRAMEYIKAIRLFVPQIVKPSLWFMWRSFPSSYRYNKGSFTLKKPCAKPLQYIHVCFLFFKVLKSNLTENGERCYQNGPELTMPLPSAPRTQILDIK